MSRSWVDITELCRQAAGTLTNQDPMLAVEEFSLLDAMSAVELMDPIMDQCYGITGPVRTEDLLKIRYPVKGAGPADAGDVDSEVPFSMLTTTQLFQSLFTYEAMFLNGSSLMESMNKCMFLWEASWSELGKRQGLGERATQAYCHSAVLSLSAQFKAILAADVYEDEDFQPTFRELLSEKQLSEDEVSAALQAMIDEVAALAGQGAGQGTGQAQGIEQPSSSSPPSQLRYLLLQLQARQKLHRFYGLMAEWTHNTIRDFSRAMKARTASSSAPLSEATVDMLNKTGDVSVYHRGCLEVNAAAQQATEALQQLIDAHDTVLARIADKAKQTESGAETRAEEEGEIYPMEKPADCVELAFAYPENLVRVTQVAPIRRVQQQRYPQSLRYLRDLCAETSTVVALCAPLLQPITNRTPTGSSSGGGSGGSGGSEAENPLAYDDVFLIAKQVSDMSAHLLNRSFFMAVLHVISPHLVALMRNSMLLRGLPASLVDSEIISQQWLGSNPCMAAWDTFKMMCTCRSRIPAVRMQAVLHVWGAVSAEALYMDDHYHKQTLAIAAATAATAATASSDSNSVSTNTAKAVAKAGQEAARQQGGKPLQWCSLWAVLHIVHVQDFYLGLMAELDLLHPCELAYFYWYWDYVCATGSYAGDNLRMQQYRLNCEDYQAVHARVMAARQVHAASGTSSAGGSSSSSSNSKKIKNKKKAQQQRKEAVGAEVSSLPLPPLPPTPELAAERAEDALVRTRGYLCRGSFRLLTVAQDLGMLAEYGPSCTAPAFTSTVASSTPYASSASSISASSPLDVSYTAPASEDSSSSSRGGGAEELGNPAAYLWVRYGSWESRFQCRFALLQEVPNPAALSYGDFLAATTPAPQHTAPPPPPTAAGTATSLDSLAGAGAGAGAGDGVRRMTPEHRHTLLQNAAVSFQQARALCEELRKTLPATPTLSSASKLLPAPSQSSMLSNSAPLKNGRTDAMTCATNSAVALLKVAVAGSLATMKLTRSVSSSIAPSPHPSATGAGAGTEAGGHPSKTIAGAGAGASLRVKFSRTYHRHFTVLEPI